MPWFKKQIAFCVAFRMCKFFAQGCYFKNKLQNVLIHNFFHDSHPRNIRKIRNYSFAFASI